MDEIIQLFFKNAKSFKTTEMILSDIKIIKKLNNLTSKYKRTLDKKYSNEIINIVIIITNSYHLSKVYKKILEHFIEEGNKKQLESIIEELI